MVAGTSCDPGATLLSYPMTGTEDIHNYIVNAEVRRIGMEGTGWWPGLLPERAKTDCRSRRRAGIQWWTGPARRITWPRGITWPPVKWRLQRSGSRWRHVAIASQTARAVYWRRSPANSSPAHRGWPVSSLHGVPGLEAVPDAAKTVKQRNANAARRDIRPILKS